LVMQIRHSPHHFNIAAQDYILLFQQDRQRFTLVSVLPEEVAVPSVTDIL